MGRISDFSFDLTGLMSVGKDTFQKVKDTEHNVQNDIKPRSRLTLFLGLRFSLSGEDVGALGRALSAVALLSQTKPPRSHTTPYKMLMEPTAADYSSWFQRHRPADLSHH
jgi:hypothetical protein